MPIKPIVKPAKNITSRNKIASRDKIEALVAMRLQALKTSGHSGSGTDKLHYSHLPIPRFVTLKNVKTCFQLRLIIC